MIIETSTAEAPRTTIPGALRPRILENTCPEHRSTPSGARAQFIRKEAERLHPWCLIKSWAVGIHL